jgi:hypothetical protein
VAIEASDLLVNNVPVHLDDNIAEGIQLMKEVFRECIALPMVLQSHAIATVPASVLGVPAVDDPSTSPSKFVCTRALMEHLIHTFYSIGTYHSFKPWQLLWSSARP